MWIPILIAKFEKLVVTHSSVEYRGSITIPGELMDKAGIRQYQEVHINNVNGNRDVTYVLRGDNPDIIAVNGNLSARHKVGDIIHVNAYGMVHNTFEIPEPTVV